jgi:hypothetical protein
LAKIPLTFSTGITISFFYFQPNTAKEKTKNKKQKTKNKEGMLF